jgi:hypothetical protein
MRKNVIVAVALIALGWTLGRAQSGQPDFELRVDAPGGKTRIECVRGCELMWVERGINPNDTPGPTFSYGCGAERCFSGTVGGWNTR